MAIFLLVESCRRHGIPVETYLRELRSAMPGVTDPEIIATLTPARIAATRVRKIKAAYAVNGVVFRSLATSVLIEAF